jgi:lipopolysaccharide biosynthesis protein
MPPQDPADLVDALRVENQQLRTHVGVLQATADEYRRQMSTVLSSASWRMTAPLRGVAGRVRTVRRRLTGLPRLVLDRATRRPTTASTSGLFAPTVASALPTTVALRSPVLPHQGPADAAPPTSRVAVVAHVYYPEVWPDIEVRLARIPEPFDLVVTLVRGRAESVEGAILAQFPGARVQVVDNRGRDMGPLVQLCCTGLLDGYDAVLKVHTKRSVHRVDGDAWRIALLDGVLPSRDGVTRILELFRRDQTVGIVAASGHLRGPETWGSDQPIVEALAARLPLAFDPEMLRYPAGSMFWIRPWLLRRIADLGLGFEHFEPEADHLDGSTAHAMERLVGLLADRAGFDQVETQDVPSRLARLSSDPAAPPNVLAFYLPQYHRSADNDRWWGDGFTDWMSVREAAPLYDGHRQPDLPGELGCYDLADAEVMRRQGALARAHGVSGFVMHHYWFDGRPVLEKPLANLLAAPDIDFPFALCWANENWTRRWDGLDQDVLLAQTYPEGWVDAFYEDIRPALHDPRYLKITGRPLLVVYRIGQVPQARDVVARWKARAVADGLGGLHVLAVTPSRDFEGLPPGVAEVVDGLVHFPPGSGIGLQSIRDLAPGLSSHHQGDIYSFDAAVDGADLRTAGPGGLPVHPGVMPGWDNTARRGASAYVFHGGNPVSFRRWLTRAVDAAAAAGPETMVFVNAWNEWAEGAHLEPDARFGRANLESVSSVLGSRLSR